jgi:hypothetical protein
VVRAPVFEVPHNASRKRYWWQNLLGAPRRATGGFPVIGMITVIGDDGKWPPVAVGLIQRIGLTERCLPMRGICRLLRWP